MKKLMIIIVIFLTGCATVIEDYQIAKLENACEKHGGIQRIVANGHWSIAVCEDGARLYHRYLD